MFDQDRAWGRQENKLLLADMPMLFHNFLGLLDHPTKRLRLEEEEACDRCVWGAGLLRVHPLFNMWFSSGKAEGRSSRFRALIRIQSSINITHPLIRSPCVCLHMLRAMRTDYIWTVLCCVHHCGCDTIGWKVESFLSRAGAFVNLLCSNENNKIREFFWFEKTIWTQWSVNITGKYLSLKDLFNFDTLWEVKRCSMQCGKVQYWPLDWTCMVAQSRTKVALTLHPSLLFQRTNIQLRAWRGVCLAGVGAHTQTDTLLTEYSKCLG